MDSACNLIDFHELLKVMLSVAVDQVTLENRAY